MADFIGATIAQKLGFLTNLSNNGTDSKTELGFTDLGWTAFQAEITALTASRTDADAAVAAGVSATSLFQLALDKAVQEARDASNAGRASALTDDTLATLGISRRNLTPTPISAPAVAPVLELQGLSPGAAVIGFSTPGSSGPRQRAAGSVGVQLSLRDSAGVLPPEAGVTITIPRSGTSIATVHPTATTLKVVGRFVTQTGLTGPWSDPIQFNPQPA